MKRSTRSEIKENSSSQLSKEVRKIKETFGTMALEWTIDKMQYYTWEEMGLTEDIELWILWQFALRQYNQYNLYESLRTFKCKESEGGYTPDMKTDFQFDQKSRNGSVITRRGNFSIRDAKVIGAWIWTDFKSDGQLQPSNGSKDTLCFEFLVSIDWLVFIGEYDSINTINKNSCNNSLNSPALKLRRNHLLIDTNRLPVSVVRDWIHTGDITDSSDPAAILVPRGVPEFFGKEGRKMFYMAKQNRFMSSEDYDKVMARLESNYHLVRPSAAPRKNGRSIADSFPSGDSSSVSSSIFLNSGLNSPYPHSNNNTVRQGLTLAEAVRLGHSAFLNSSEDIGTGK